jgi:hypothetical protein
LCFAGRLQFFSRNCHAAPKSTALKNEFCVALQADLGRPVLREEIFRFLFTPNQWFLVVVPPQ